MLTELQIDRVLRFRHFCSKYIPQLTGPAFLVNFLAKTLPDSCPFERAVYFRGKLVVYIPILCCTNPWYEAVIEQKAKLKGW